MLLFARVSKWYPFKTIQIPASPQTTPLKPMQPATTRQIKGYRITRIRLKPTSIPADVGHNPSKTRTPHARDNSLPTTPALRRHVSHAPAQLRHASQKRTEIGIEMDFPVPGLPKPPIQTIKKLSFA